MAVSMRSVGEMGNRRWGDEGRILQKGEAHVLRWKVIDSELKAPLI